MKKTVFYLAIILIISCNKSERGEYVDISTATQKRNGITKYNFYNKNGKLDKTLEYIDLCGKKYLNQGWYFDENGDTLKKKSHFYKVFIEKNILKPKETSKVTMNYNPIFKHGYSGILLNRDNIDVKNCNISEGTFDTIYFVDNKLEFYPTFKTKGKKKIGGYILEVTDEIKRKIKQKAYSERKVYFTFEFEVK